MKKDDPDLFNGYLFSQTFQAEGAYLRKLSGLKRQLEAYEKEQEKK